MKTNAYILDWTMGNYNRLLVQLKKQNFSFFKEDDENHIRVVVPFSRVDEFANLVKEHLNVAYNYVDIQYPQEKKTVVIFQKEKFFIGSEDENEKAKKWAIDLGLPISQADWGKSF